MNAAFIISITTCGRQPALAETVHRLTNGALPFFTATKKELTTHFLFALAGQESNETVADKLGEAFGFDNVRVVGVNTLDQGVLASVRHLFGGAGVDTRNLSDEEISLFIESAREGQHLYYLQASASATDSEHISLRLVRRQMNTNRDGNEDRCIVTEIIVIYPPPPDIEDDDPEL